MFSKAFEQAINNIEGLKVNSFDELYNMGFTFKNDSDADELIRMFPKYMKVYKGTMFTNNCILPCVHFNLSNITSNVTGEINEAGQKRRNKFLEILKANDIDINALIKP